MIAFELLSCLFSRAGALSLQAVSGDFQGFPMFFQSCPITTDYFLDWSCMKPPLQLDGGIHAIPDRELIKTPFTSVQGDTSICFLGLVDLKTKVEF